jgi:hypothetical protein
MFKNVLIFYNTCTHGARYVALCVCVCVSTVMNTSCQYITQVFTTSVFLGLFFPLPTP